MANIKNSYNTGDVTAVGHVGGIVGDAYYEGVIIVDRCYNTGTIKSTTKDNYKIAGIVAINYYSTVFVLNSYNTGSLINPATGTPSIASGILNWNNGSPYPLSVIINSYNEGSISAGYWGAGLFGGNFNTATIKVYNSYNRGNITGKDIYGVGWYKSGSYAPTLQDVYYKSGSFSSNGKGTSMADADMKSQTFVDSLNTNKNGITLSSIDSRLSDYTLCNWKLGTSGYPELACS